MKGRIVYVAILLGGLAVTQVWAQVEQVHEGYRPFVTSPTRVSYSWDMFATPVERCAVSWDPPLHVEDRTVRTMSERDAPVEWGTVYDDRAAYREFALDACQTFGAPGATITLRCALPSGTVEETRELCH
ncbi:hypothetical protein BH09MYX1_BH09MYX1_15540 [soil metagenome]